MQRMFPAGAVRFNTRIIAPMSAAAQRGMAVTGRGGGHPSIAHTLFYPQE